MTNTTDFESVHPRADSGAFTDKAQGAPELPPLSEDAAQARIHEAQVALDSAQDRFRAAQKDMHLANAKVIAAEILADRPEARYLTLDESAHEGCAWFALEVTDEAGETIDTDVAEDLHSCTSDLPVTIPDVYTQHDGGFTRSDEPGYEWLIFDDRGRNPKIDLHLAIKIGE